MRKMMHHRLVICPFECLIPHVPPGASVLDAGCGAGLFLALLAATVPNISGVGFDSSRPAIDAAVRMTERFQALGLPANLRFVRLDAAASWPEGLFDVVSMVDVMHHVPPAGQRSALARAAASLKPGGLLLYKDLADHPALHAGLNRLHDLVLARQWIHYLPVHLVEEWAGALGLTLTHAEAISRLWYRHELRIFRMPLGR